MVLKQFVEAVNVSVEEGMTTNLIAENIKAASIVISMLPMLICLSVRIRNFSPRVS